MLRSLVIVGALLAGCAGNLEKAAARHDANAFVLDAAGEREAALREREKADRAREQLEWWSGQDRDYVPHLTAFNSF